jgi:hypothetical protein
MIRNRAGYLVNMDVEQHIFDLGELYYFSSRVENSSSVTVYRFKTGAKKVNISFNLIAGAKVKVDVIEGVTITGEGTAAKLFNHNRNFKDDDALTKFFTGAITYTGGEVIKLNQSGFGTAPGQASAGQGIPGAGYQLKPNTEYIVLFTPGSATDMVFTGDLYEVD